MNKRQELSYILASFVALEIFIAFVFAWSLFFGLWLCAAISFMASLLGGIIGYYVYRFFANWLKELSHLSLQAKEKGMEWEASELLCLPQEIAKLFDHLEKLKTEKDNLTQQEENLYSEKEKLQTQQIKLHNQNEALLREKQNLQERVAYMLEHVESAILIVNIAGILMPPHSKYWNQLAAELKLTELTMEEIFRASLDSQKSKIFLNWFEGLEKKGWQEIPAHIQSLPFASGKNIKYLQFQFFPIHREKVLEKLLVEIRDITQAQITSKSLETANKKVKTSIAAACEIIKADIPLIKSFTQETKKNVHLLHKQANNLIEKSTVTIIRNLLENTREIKNNLGLLQFKSALDEALRLETLLNILAGSKQISSAQVLEVREQVAFFGDLIEHYVEIIENLFGDPEQNPNKLLPTSFFHNRQMSDSRYLLLTKYFRSLYHASLSAASSPAEVIRYVKQTRETFHSIGFYTPVLDQELIEFVDISERIWQSLSNKIKEREMQIELNNGPGRVLLYGNYFKIMELMTMVLHAAILRGEVTSTVQISYKIAQGNGYDVLQVETSAAIRNTSRKTLEILDKWRDTGKQYAIECGGKLEDHKRGFCLKLPLVADKFFLNPFVIGIIGQSSSELRAGLQEVSRWFPFDIELVDSPDEYNSLSILIIEARALENLGWHIKDKKQELEHYLPLIALVPGTDREMIKQMFDHGADECLKIPAQVSDIRWTLLACMNLIINPAKK